MLRCMTICSHMICPFCHSPTKIYNSRSTHQKSQTWRRHRCKQCGRTFTTRERIDWTGRVEVKSPDSTTGYSRERLLLSLAKASNNLSVQPAMLAELCDSVEGDLQKLGFFAKTKQESDLITQTAISVLHRYNPNYALQYVNIVYSNKPPLELIKRLVGAENEL